ncbi:MAG: hypothetical protein Q8S32_11370 [Burkholderiaceae bacterium]|nr:hypothetical protein [Burkholderiaceae bacterium]
MPLLFEQWKEEISREEECSKLVNRYSLYARQLFTAYEPLLRDEPLTDRIFLGRLDRWLRNWQSDDDRWDAFRFVDHIFFVGSSEFQELFRVAFETNLWGWVAEDVGGNPASKATRMTVEVLLKKTWCCPITDSFRINSFRHFNHIETPDYFPDWRSLEKFGDKAKIKKYLADANIERIVLLEDFVGSGNQATDAIEFAASLGLPVLILPLIIGKRGHAKFSALATKHKNLTYSPVIWLDSNFIVSADAQAGEADEKTMQRRLISNYAQITTDSHPYGYEQAKFSENQGYLVVLYTNCPNNTVNPIHADLESQGISGAWTPLFPRSGRAKKK